MYYVNHALLRRSGVLFPNFFFFFSCLALFFGERRAPRSRPTTNGRSAYDGRLRRRYQDIRDHGAISTARHMAPECPAGRRTTRVPISPQYRTNDTTMLWDIDTIILFIFIILYYCTSMLLFLVQSAALPDNASRDVSRTRRPIMSLQHARRYQKCRRLQLLVAVKIIYNTLPEVDYCHHVSEFF